VLVNASSSVRFSDCTIAHTGGAGLRVKGGSHDVIWDRGAIADTSGGGVYLGDVVNWQPSTPIEEQDVGLALTNSAIVETGVEYWGGVGAFVGYASSTRIEGCTITNQSYSAVSLGWGWSTHASTGTVSRNNEVVACHLDRYLGNVVDGGGVYHLGPSPGTSATRNLFTRQVQSGGGHGGALYMDDGTANVTYSSNVIANLTDPKSYWIFAWTPRDTFDAVVSNWRDQNYT